MDNVSHSSISDNQLPPHHRWGWKSLLVLTVAVMTGAIVIGLWALQFWRQNQPHTTAPGKIIDSYGRYQSLSGRTRLVITPNEDPSNREIAVAAESVGRSYPIGLSFDTAADWFASFDESDRVWLYTSSDGVCVWTTSDGIISGVSQVGDESWEGIPDEFLQKLPEKHRAEYEAWVKNRGVLPAE